MASKTYYAGKPISIEAKHFEAGDIIGTGDVDAGQFKAADGLEKIVELGHVIPRLQDGRIVTEQPKQEKSASSTPSSDDGNHDAVTENFTDTDETNETLTDETHATPGKGRKARK